MSLYSQRDRQKDHLHETLQATLRRNGIEIASLKQEANGSYTLQVKGHDSPLIEYTNLSQKQVDALTDGGTISSNKKAYNTFASIIAADFDIPKNYTSAQNARSRVNMGQYGQGGYNVKEIASSWMPLINHPLFRHADGNHHLGVEKPGPERHYFGHGRFIPPLHLYEDYRLGDEKLKPGELSRNSSGFYYKNNAVTKLAQNQQEALTALEGLTLQKKAKIYQGEPVAYKDLISSNVYFSAEKFNEVLSSHGINIDSKENTMVVHAKNASTDFNYYLTDEELFIINNPSLKEYSIEDRLEVINNIISEDYNGKVSFDTLNSKDLVDLTIKPEILQMLKKDVAHAQQYGVNYDENLSLSLGQERGKQLSDGSVLINGNDLKNLDNFKAWYREGKHGREVEVGDILVERIVTPPIANKEEAKEFQSKVEDLAVGQEKVLIKDPKNLLEVEAALKNKTISLESTSRNIDFHVTEVEKSSKEDSYVLTDEDGNKINVPTNNVHSLSEGKYARIEVIDEDGLFDHYAQASIKPSGVMVHQDNSQQRGLDPNLQYNGDVKYKMSAVIDGKVVSHEITQKQYDKFMAVDDMHRMKMFSKIFGEVDMKSNTRLGEKIGAAFLATAAFLVAPTLYAEAHSRGPVMPPIHEMAAHNFEEMMAIDTPSMHRGI